MATPNFRNGNATCDGSDPCGDGLVHIQHCSTGISVRPVQIDVRPNSQRQIIPQRSGLLQPGTNRAIPRREPPTARNVYHNGIETLLDPAVLPNRRPDQAGAVRRSHALGQHTIAAQSQPRASPSLQSTTEDTVRPTNVYGVPESIKKQHIAFFTQNPPPFIPASSITPDPCPFRRSSRGDRAHARTYNAADARRERATFQALRSAPSREAGSFPSALHTPGNLRYMPSSQWQRDSSAFRLHQPPGPTDERPLSMPNASFDQNTYRSSRRLQYEASAKGPRMSQQEWKDKAEALTKVMQDMQDVLQRVRLQQITETSSSRISGDHRPENITRGGHGAMQDAVSQVYWTADEGSESAQDVFENAVEHQPEQYADDQVHGLSLGSQPRPSSTQPKESKPAELPPLRAKSDHWQTTLSPLVDSATGMPTPPKSNKISASSTPQRSTEPRSAPGVRQSLDGKARLDSPTLGASTKGSDEAAKPVSESRTTILENAYASSTAADAGISQEASRVSRPSRYRLRQPSQPFHQPSRWPGDDGGLGRVRNFSLPFQSPGSLPWHLSHVPAPRNPHEVSCCGQPWCCHKRIEWILSSSRYKERMENVEHVFRDTEAVIISQASDRRAGAVPTARIAPEVMAKLDTAATNIMTESAKVERKCRLVKQGVSVSPTSTARGTEAMENPIIDGLILSLEKLEATAKQAEDILSSIQPSRQREMRARVSFAGPAPLGRQRSADTLALEPPSNTARTQARPRQSCIRTPRPTSLPAHAPAAPPVEKTLRFESPLPDLDQQSPQEARAEQVEELRPDGSWGSLVDDRVKTSVKPKKSVRFRASLPSLKFWSNSGSSEDVVEEVEDEGRGWKSRKGVLQYLSRADLGKSDGDEC